MRATHFESETIDQKPGSSGSLQEQPSDHREIFRLPQQNEESEAGQTELTKRVQQNDSIGNEKNPQHCELYCEDAGLASVEGVCLIFT